MVLPSCFAGAMESEFPFGFPFKPYDIQLDLMNKIYETLQNEQIGIFSSPTGRLQSMDRVQVNYDDHNDESQWIKVNHNV